MAGLVRNLWTSLPSAKLNAHVPGRIRLVLRAIQTIHQEPLPSLFRDESLTCGASPNFRLNTVTEYDSVRTEKRRYKFDVQLYLRCLLAICILLAVFNFVGNLNV
jgi:hypothetical protein